MLKKKIWANFQTIIELFIKKIAKKLLKIWSWDPGSEIRDLEKTYSGSRIQGSERHRIPDPDPQHCVNDITDPDPTWSKSSGSDQIWIHIAALTFCGRLYYPNSARYPIYLLEEILVFFMSFARKLVSESVRMHGFTDSAITLPDLVRNRVIGNKELFFKQSHYGSAFYVRCGMRYKISLFLNLLYVRYTECQARIGSLI